MEDFLGMTNVADVLEEGEKYFKYDEFVRDVPFSQLSAM